ncbi:MAG: hypothetical protein ACRCX8_15380 [Sarcina sp.]
MKENLNLEVKAFEVVKGGEYDDVTLLGNAKIKGDVTAKVVEISGIGNIGGEITAENLMISGTFLGEKDVNLKNSINSKGTTTLNKGLNCTEIIGLGELTVKGNCKFTNAKIMGKFSSKGIITGNKLSIMGQVDMSSDIRVNDVQIEFLEKSNVNDIIADNIAIQTKKEEKKGLLGKLQLKTKFKCNEIRAKNVCIENVDCKVIVADVVEIGENCKVERVEYIDKFEFDKSSEVKETLCKKA